ncbi:helix-turn-helix domain-containing protein [Paenibacillus macquariensis]|uniref:Cro/C1-type HTH DNA-binding domain-containing protein n=1 Tax=Paenibacillus macquariensis TaxID=948756 RepID=A0ABY1K1H0_9BACL|nr:helix-turn-helix transcriptional regulator [Paenibacillus macquariensis]MEC0091793.1 helix-turn-helix transcriptional regulator [Paenibacillus macquariensis]OAB32295.1 transcriptional regulator [Paenibacillus macquariensis subsp. macquariensis]SIR11869.1 Cro/C1-type HTH DNA-binding domain-containing protein [Paenibacillus macquariensis]
MKIVIKLKEAMKTRGVTQLQLAEMASVRQAAISELCRNAREEVNLNMLNRIAIALNITDISELMQFEETV